MGLDPLQEPPSTHDMELPVVDVPDEGGAESAWYRIHPAALDAVHFNREPTFRFNAPAREYGVLYVSERAEGAFAETLLGRRKRPPLVSLEVLRGLAISRLMWPRPLRLADFCGFGLGWLGLDGRIAADDAYELARRWSVWVHGHPACVDGIVYYARNAPSIRTAALFEDRAGAPRISEVLENQLVDSRGRAGAMLLHLVRTFKVGLVR